MAFLLLILHGRIYIEVIDISNRKINFISVIFTYENSVLTKRLRNFLSQEPFAIEPLINGTTEPVVMSLVDSLHCRLQLGIIFPTDDKGIVHRKYHNASPH